MARTEFIPWAKPNYWGKEKEFVTQALESTWISGGEFVDKLEKEIAAFCCLPYALTACNGTAAIQMAFLAHHLQAGDEVIVPGFAFMAAANMAIHLGAKPVFAEVDPDTWCMTAENIAKCISARTKLIVPVHTYGNVCPMDDILSLAKIKRIPVVEDAAEAFSSRYRGVLAGAMGSIGTFSFHATKTITTGEGGMVITADKDLLDTMFLYRNHGMLRQRYYWHELAGHNFRMTNLQSALGCAQLQELPHIIQERKRIHAQYQSQLADVPGLIMQYFPPEIDPTLWAFAVKLDSRAYPQGRDQLMAQMLEARIETRPGFYAASLLDFYHCSRLPVCEEISRQVISLPAYATLQNKEIEYICLQLQRLRH